MSKWEALTIEDFVDANLLVVTVGLRFEARSMCLMKVPKDRETGKLKTLFRNSTI